MSDGVTEVDISGALRKLDAAQRAGRDLRPVWKEIRPLLRADIMDHFAKRQSPDGAWSPFARASVERIQAGTYNSKRSTIGDVASKTTKLRVVRNGKIKRGGSVRRGEFRMNRRGLGQVKNQLGRLKGAIAFVVRATELIAKSKVPWAGVHQHGGTAGKGSHIPQRTFMWAGNDLVRVVGAKIVERVEQLFKEAR